MTSESFLWSVQYTKPKDVFIISPRKEADPEFKKLEPVNVLTCCDFNDKLLELLSTDPLLELSVSVLISLQGKERGLD